MADETPPLTNEELDARIAQSDLGTTPLDNGVSRGQNLLGSATRGFGEAAVHPVAAAARLVGDEAAANRLQGYLRAPGATSVNPAMAEDISTGIAKYAGSAPILALENVAGLPGIVGAGALSGYEGYREALADYETRKAAGQLEPGEAPPSATGAVTKGALSNAAYLVGGGAGGAVAKRLLPAVEGRLARAATAYGGTVGGNLLGSAAARTIETGTPAYPSGAAFGEDITGATTFPFGVPPARHLLGAPQAKFGYKPPPKVEAPTLPEVPHPLEVAPELSLLPQTQALAKAATPAEAPTNAPQEVVQPPGLRLQPQGGVAGGEAQEAGAGNLLQPAAPVQGGEVPGQEVTQPPTSNETRNETQLGQPIGNDLRPNGTVDQTGNAGELLRGQILGQAGPGPVDTGQQLRGQGELGGGPAQRPVLTVPESQATLLEQQKQLESGQRPAVFFPNGTRELPRPAGVGRTVTESGIWHFNPALTDAEKIKAADAAGRQNELLGLGPENKADVQAAPGTPVVVTERTPEGVEVKAAAASEAQASATAQELEAQKTPGNVIGIETPEQVIAERNAQNGTNGPLDTPASRNQAVTERLHATISALDQQIGEARRTGFEAGRPRPGEAAAASREALRDLEAQRQDASDELMSFTPESEAPVEPPTAAEQAHTAQAQDLHARLAETQAKLKAQEAVVDSLRPENAKQGVDENGNVVEQEPRNAEDRAALNEAKAEAASLRRATQFLQQKIAENARQEPPQVIGAPRDPLIESKKNRTQRLIDDIFANSDNYYEMRKRAQALGIATPRGEKMLDRYISALHKSEDRGTEPPDEHAWQEKITYAVEADVNAWEKKNPEGAAMKKDDFDAMVQERLEEREREGRQGIFAPNPRAVEQAAGKFQASPEKVQAFVDHVEANVLPKFEAQIRSLFGDGVRIVRDSDRVETIGVVPTRDGGVEVHISPDYTASIGAQFGDGAGAHFAKSLGEEGVHVAVLRAIKEMWQKAGTPGDFYEFTKGVMSRISGDILDTVKSLRAEGKHGEAHAIEQAIRNSKELYDGELQNSNSLTGRQILEQMAKDPATAFKYANELLRQFAQLRQNKQITETTYQRIARALTDLYRKAQASIKNLVGKAHEGELGKTAGDVLRRTEELLKGQKPEGKEVRAAKVDTRSQEKLSKLETSVIPWHGGADDQNARSISRDTPGYSPAEAAADHLAASAPPGPDPLRPDQRNVVDLAKLAQFESGRGRLIDRGALLNGNPDVLGGGEHQVLFEPGTQRWLKFTRPGQSGLFTDRFQTDFPLPEGVHAVAARNATPAEYLDRMRLANEKFGDDWQYHGVWLDSAGEPGGIVSSQPHIEGADAHQLDITRQMKADGFKRIGTETWYRPTDRLMVDDAAPRNFVVKDGVTQPIDVPLRVADDELHNEAMKIIGSGKTFEKPAERALPFGNRRLQEPAVIGAPRIVEKAKQSLAEKTKEYRYLWGKNYKGFKDSLFRAVDVIDTTGNNEGAKVTNSVYNEFAKAGGGKILGINEASPELQRAAEVAFPLREAGFGDATTPQEMVDANTKLQDFIARIDKGLKSTDLAVKEAAEKLKPYYDEAYKLVHTDLGQALLRAGKIAQETNRQLSDAASAGVDIEGVDNYIRRVYEQDLNQQDAQYVPSAGGRGGLGYDKGFLKPRAYESAVDAMEGGKKLANLNTAQLLGQGEASLQKLIGEKKLYDELRTANSPTTNVPVITKPLRVWNPRLGSFVEHAPDGYTKVDGPGGKPIYVEQNVAPLFRILASPSWVRTTSFGRTLLRVAAGIKHGTLLFDSYHAARQALNLAGLLTQGGNPAEIRRFIKKGLASLDIRPEELDDFVKHGAITEEDAKYVRDNQAKIIRATNAGVNFGKQLDNLYEQIGKPFWVSVLNGIPRPKGGGVGDYITDFNKWVFQKAARSAMMVGFNEAVDRNQARFPKASQEEVDRMSAKEVNEIFGNMGRQGLFKSKTAQDISRLFMLAPQWNDARLRFQGRAIAQTARAVGRLAIGKPEALGNAGGVLLALAGGSFAANQLLNLATTGKPTWDNPEGHKLDAFVPGGKNGFYYSPLNLAAEDVHTILKYGATQSPLQTATRIAMNKASGLARAGAALGGIGPTGRPLPTDVGRLSQAGKNLLPIPIFASPLTSPLLQPELAQKGDMQRQLFGMAGIKLDRAESPEQRLRALANRTAPPQFPKVESPGDYSKLRNYVSNEKLGDAKSEILDLISKGKTPDQIIKAFSPARTFTQSKQADALLMRQPLAVQLRNPAVQNRIEDLRALQGAMLAARQDPKYAEAILKGRQIKQPTQ